MVHGVPVQGVPVQGVPVQGVQVPPPHLPLPSPPSPTCLTLKMLTNTKGRSGLPWGGSVATLWRPHTWHGKQQQQQQ